MSYTSVCVLWPMDQKTGSQSYFSQILKLFKVFKKMSDLSENTI